MGIKSHYDQIGGSTHQGERFSVIIKPIHSLLKLCDVISDESVVQME